MSNSSNIYVKTREILLQYFDFVAIAEFGSGTFGKTGTNTVVLFLRRKKSEPELATHYRNRVEAWFSNNHGQDHRYEDADTIERYAQHIDVPCEEYMTLLEGNPSDELMKHEIFAAYHATFSDNTAAKNIKKKRLTARYTQAMKDAELAKHILDSIRNVEKDKLFYFMLCESNSQPVVVVKSPTKTADTKKFLGYEWSNRKGSEGIKYLGAIIEDDDNDISANKGIQQIQTPLFNPQNLASDEKINTLIRKNYLGEDLEVPEELCEFVDSYRLVDMLDFKRVDLDKAIKTTPILVYPKIECKEVISSEKLSVVAPYVTASIKMSSISVADYITTDNMLQNRGGIVTYNGIPNIDSITEFRKGDILVSNIRPYLKKIWMADRDGGCSKDVLVFRNAKPAEILNEYLKVILSTDTFFDYMMVGKKGVKMPRGDKKVIPNFEIPIPSSDIQKKIADECKKVDEECKFAKESIINKETEIAALIRSIKGDSKSISSILKFSSGNYLPANKMRKGHVPVYGGNGITGYHDISFISEQTIVIGRVGEYCGSVYLTEPNCWITDNALYCKEFLENVNRVYLMYALRDANLNQFANRTGQPNISQNAIANVKIVIPSKMVQDECAKQLLEIQNEIDALESQVESCAQAKQSILNKYLK